MVPDPEIRSALPTDADAVASLTLKAYSAWVALIGREPLPMQIDYRNAIEVHDFALIEHEGDLVGLIETTPEADALLIVNVAVEPTCQGRGLGRRLMSHAEDVARSRGLKRTRLYTNQLFDRNIKLYASLGYQLDREEALNGGVAVHMSKPLP
jgi:N-acetylglutamate synthase-like GNAT family acetyltransferase